MTRFSCSAGVDRRCCLKQLGAASLLGMTPLFGQAKTRRHSVSLNISLEPDGLDPTRFASSACGQVVLYNVLEGLVKIAENGAIEPLLARKWHIDHSRGLYSFELVDGVRFHDGNPLDADCVAFSFHRAQAADSINKAKKSVFDNIKRITTLGKLHVEIELFHPDPHFLFRLGEATAVIFHPASAETATEHPIGTGPYAFASWQKGHSIHLRKAKTYRHADRVAIEKASFRFISNLTQQALALERGEVDVFINFITNDLHRFHGDPRYQVLLGASSGKGMLALNHRHLYLKDKRVRQALTYAIDRQVFVNEILQGKGSVIGSHFAPSDPGYLHLAHTHAYNPGRAKELLKQAKVPHGLELILTALPVPYAREGAPLIAHYLEQVGIKVHIKPVTWKEWLRGTFQGKFDLTIINHVEPLDHMIYCDPDYYFGYDNAQFRALAKRHTESRNPRERQMLYAAIQRFLANDAANVWLFTSQVSAVARKGLQGLWTNYPIFNHDLGALSWDV